MTNSFQAAVLAAGIVVGALISEDAATISAASLAASGTLDARVAFISAFGGVWFGDIALYAIARWCRGAWEHSRWKRALTVKSAGRWTTDFVRRWGSPALLASR